MNIAEKKKNDTNQNREAKRGDLVTMMMMIKRPFLKTPTCVKPLKFKAPMFVSSLFQRKFQLYMSNPFFFFCFCF